MRSKNLHASGQRETSETGQKNTSSATGRGESTLQHTVDDRREIEMVFVEFRASKILDIEAAIE